ncbi:hypothetical protein DY000_02050971 [Brassica cretica]|uniref:BING4 C-terminal domain-containing protein n=1 Tax=Brassica cretica TaxID=69181 RepID=A0ABQ7EQC6_BRACR|nr:hypothetical protein DY000_02050971 [Brassica cretica]
MTMEVALEDNNLMDKVLPPDEQEIDVELEAKEKKYLRGEGANLETLKDKKLKTQLASREKLYGKSAKAAAKIEKWLLPASAGYLETDGLEKTWRVKQTDIAKEVDILSSRNQYDIVLPDFGPYKLDFTASGRHMLAGGRKGHLALVDMMSMNLIKEIQKLMISAVKFEEVQTIHGFHAKTLSFSQKGLLAAGTGSFVQVLGDSSGDYSRYMSHSMVKGYQIEKVMFRPYEDVLGIGHSMGWSSVLIPGSGEPNFDSWVANPFETTKQRREKEVHLLLDKLPPETIMLDPSKIGAMRPSRRKERLTRGEIEAEKEVASDGHCIRELDEWTGSWAKLPRSSISWNGAANLK